MNLLVTAKALEAEQQFEQHLNNKRIARFDFLPGTVSGSVFSIKIPQQTKEVNYATSS